MNTSEQILEATVRALAVPAEERFFRTERGYQGRFYCALQAELDRRHLLQNGAILEMEYQKRARHRTSQRPDVVFHVPVEYEDQDVAEGNLAVFALKRRASRAEALSDFEKLDKMCVVLNYPVAVFINIDSAVTYRDAYTGAFADRLHAFAVRLVDGMPLVVSG